MAKAIFIAPHTLAFAGGILVVAAVMFALPIGRQINPEQAGTAIMAAMILLCALMEAALFSLGCAWGGEARLTRPRPAFVAGVVAAIGFVALQGLMGTTPAPMDMEGHKRQGLYAMLGTTYVFLAPVMAGILCAWICKRAR